MPDVRDVFDRLLRHFGPQGWWPAETPFEVVVGALLMAQTSWSNVERALANLSSAGLMEPTALADAPLEELRRLVRPAGLHRTKPTRLRNVGRHIVRVAGGDLDRFFSRDVDALRSELLTLDGVGPETADSILLYAGGFPTFVVDAYTIRIGQRMGWFRTDRYDAVQAYMESRLPRDVSLYREYHALLVAHARAFCRPRPRCAPCPVRDACAYGRGTLK